jgi:hypothetical protein
MDTGILQHRRIYRVSPEILKRVFTGGALWSCIDGIPIDAEILDIYQEHVGDDVFINCAHVEFEEVPRGEGHRRRG